MYDGGGGEKNYFKKYWRMITSFTTLVLSYQINEPSIVV